MNEPIARPSLAAPPRARTASTSPVSPTTPISGDSAVCPVRENALPCLPGPYTATRVASGSMVSRSPVGAAPAAQARRSMTRLVAAALLTRPRSAPARNRHSVEVDGSTLSPRNAAVAGSASNARSDRKSPPASNVSTSARKHSPPLYPPGPIGRRPRRSASATTFNRSSSGSHNATPDTAVRSSCDTPTFGVRCRRREELW
jgi:hypothetical protein